jgi:hypothetical protein
VIFMTCLRQRKIVMMKIKYTFPRIPKLDN